MFVIEKLTIITTIVTRKSKFNQRLQQVTTGVQMKIVYFTNIILILKCCCCL